MKLATLACLTALVQHHAAGIKPAALEPVLSELPALVDESDMHVSQVWSRVRLRPLSGFLAFRSVLKTSDMEEFNMLHVFVKGTFSSFSSTPPLTWIISHV